MMDMKQGIFAATAPVIVRKAGHEDKPQLIRMLKAQMEEHDISISEKEISFAVDGLIACPDKGALLVALCGDLMLGVACLSYIWTIENGGKSAWLQELYVLPAFRNQGAGQQLLSAASVIATANGCSAIDLEVEFSHGRVENLYQRNGFRQHTRKRWVKELHQASSLLSADAAEDCGLESIF